MALVRVLARVPPLAGDLYPTQGDSMKKRSHLFITCSVLSILVYEHMGGVRNQAVEIVLASSTNETVAITQTAKEKVAGIADLENVSGDWRHDWGPRMGDTLSKLEKRLRDVERRR